MISALAAPDHSPQLAIADAAAAVEAADAVRAVIRRAQSGRPRAVRPAGPVARPDRQRPELAEGETPARVMAAHVLDPVQLGILARVGGFLPGPGALKADAADVQDLAQPLPANRHRPARAR